MAVTAVALNLPFLSMDTSSVCWGIRKGIAAFTGVVVLRAAAGKPRVMSYPNSDEVSSATSSGAVPMAPYGSTS